MATVNVSVEVDMTELLSAVWDNLTTAYSPWLHRYSFDSDNNDGTETVKVHFESPMVEGGKVKKKVTPEMLLEAFGKCYGKTIWGQTVDAEFDFDTLVSDYILQIALFGEEVYA
jgi:hypothetical protein